MDLIKNNPYRILGILVGTSTREEHSKAKKLKMYVDAEQDVPEDFSFPTIGTLKRTKATVEEAISKLTLNGDRVLSSIFWFYNGNGITDEPVFDALKSSLEEAKKAVEVWIKLTATDEISKRNASAYQNLSTLYLNSAFKKSTISKKNLEKGITLKLKFLESEFLNDLVRSSSDETYKISKVDLQINFLREVYSAVEKIDMELVDWYLEIISKTTFSAKTKYLESFVSKPINYIKNAIDETKAKRKANQAKSYELGLNLYSATVARLDLIKSILSKTDIQYTSITDKVSDEVLQCGIDYFKKYKDSNTDPSAKAMDLFSKAKKLAVGSIAVQRCQENTANLQEWINEKPERDKHEKISSDLNALIKVFEQYDNLPETIANARTLIRSCSPYLQNIKTILGTSDELYLKLSTRIVSQAQGYIIDEVNQAQDNFDYKIKVDRYGTLSKIKTALRNGWEVTNIIGALDMEHQYKTERFNPNKEALRNLCKQLDISTSSSAPSTAPRVPSSVSTPQRSAPTYTQPESEGIPGWAKFIGFVILIVIMTKVCGSGTKDSGQIDSYNTTVMPVEEVTPQPAVDSMTSDTTTNYIENATIIDSSAVENTDYISNSSLRDIIGTWYGRGEQFDTHDTWSIKLNIDPQNGTYEIEYPSSGCKGILTLRENQGIVFTENIYSGNCINNLRDEIIIIDSDHIKINYYYDYSNELIAQGYLTR